MATKTKPTGLEKLFEDQVADLYYAEKKLVSALKKMAGKATDKKLSAAFLAHREETQGQVLRLEEVFEILGKPAKGKKCDAIEGLLKEADGIMEEFQDDPALDAALVCAAQKVEHYEIGSYGCLVTYAEELGMKDAAKLLKETLKEEKGADEKLTKLAESSLNMAGEAHRENKASSPRPSSHGPLPLLVNSSKGYMERPLDPSGLSCSCTSPQHQDATLAHCVLSLSMVLYELWSSANRNP